ncbi:MAG: M56 family metallopeptidase [Evtepia sp.]|nr:M56 family metallopeptidase [Evtepia sp.]
MTNLWAFLLQTLYVAGVGLLLLAIKTLLKDKLSPRWQYAVWAVLALRILLPAYTGKYYVLLPLPLWVETAKVMVEPHWASAYTNVYEATQVTSPIPWLTGAPVSLSDWLFLLYVVGVVVTLLWYLISWLRLCLLLRQGTPVPADVQEQIERIGKTYACKTCRVIELPGLPSPMVCGVFRPVLALPKGKALDDHVILHELLHLNYKDALQNVFWCFCRTLHWCNPIVRLLLNRVGNDMESLCDQRVLERLRGEDRRNYGISLLAMANDKYPRAVGTTSLSNGGKNIAQRIEAIVRFKRYPRGMALASVCVVVVLAASCLVGMVDKEEPLYGMMYFGPKTDREVAVSHLNYCTTVAGALDTYAKGIINESSLCLAMATTGETQKEMEALARTGTYRGLPSEIEVYHAIDHDVPSKESVRYQLGYVYYDKMEAPSVRNLQKEKDGSYSALLVLYVTQVLDPELHYITDDEGKIGGQLVFSLKVWKEGVRYVVQQLGDSVLYTEGIAGTYSPYLVPALKTYAAEGNSGSVVVTCRSSHRVGTYYTSSGIFGGTSQLREDPDPNAEFWEEVPSYQYQTEYTFSGSEAEKAALTQVESKTKPIGIGGKVIEQSNSYSSRNDSGNFIEWTDGDGRYRCSKYLEGLWDGTLVCNGGTSQYADPPEAFEVQILWNKEVKETLTAKEVPTNGA